MQIAYTMAPGRGDTDLLLAGLARALQGQRFRLAGTVQINTERAIDGPCDMDVMVLPDGPVVRISQDLGKDSHGCRLDPAALETAVAEVEGRLDDGIDLLIVNKFGKHEANGRGFRPVIAEALGRGIPVLVGLNRLNVEAFEAFSDGLALAVSADAAALRDWARSVLGLTGPHADAEALRETAC